MHLGWRQGRERHPNSTPIGCPVAVGVGLVVLRVGVVRRGGGAPPPRVPACERLHLPQEAPDLQADTRTERDTQNERCKGGGWTPGAGASRTSCGGKARITSEWQVLSHVTKTHPPSAPSWTPLGALPAPPPRPRALGLSQRLLRPRPPIFVVGGEREREEGGELSR